MERWMSRVIEDRNGFRSPEESNEMDNKLSSPASPHKTTIIKRSKTIKDGDGQQVVVGGRERGSKEGEGGMRESESRFGFSAGLGGRLVLAVGRAQPCHWTAC